MVAFHTRNVPHFAHERVQLRALEESHADGLFLDVAVGPKRAGDFLPGVVLKAYQTMLDFGRYPTGRVALGAVANYPRSCGAREIVFQALCSKNYGCSHVVVGPNHSDTSAFYTTGDSQKLFEELGEIGVVPIFVEELGFDPRLEEYVPLDRDGVQPLRSHQARESFPDADAELPPWFIA